MYLKAPFTEKRIEIFNKKQEDKKIHPYTCCGFEGCIKEKNEGKLIATKEGLICPCGKYTQDWIHDNKKL